MGGGKHRKGLDDEEGCGYAVAGRWVRGQRAGEGNPNGRVDTVVGLSESQAAAALEEVPEGVVVDLEHREAHHHVPRGPGGGREIHSGDPGGSLSPQVRRGDIDNSRLLWVLCFILGNPAP